MSSPSAACQTCKIRRIKCDLTKPKCGQCIKSRRICLETNAAKQACFSIHLENCYASGKTKRPRGPRSSLTILRPYFDLHSRALAFYLQHHVATIGTPNVSGCLSDCVLAWKASARTCVMVDLALSSMALVVYSRAQHNPAAATEASSTYSRLLRLVYERISQVGTPALDEQNIDACLLAVFIMARYEGASHRLSLPYSKQPLQSLLNWSHHDGAMVILKIWNDRYSHKTPTAIIKHTRRGLIKCSLLRAFSLPDWILNGERFGERGLELTYDRFLVRIVNLHSASIDIRQRRSKQNKNVDELNNEAQELDKSLQDWAVQIPITYSYQQHELTEPGPWPKKYFYSPKVYSYSKYGYAAMWGEYFAARMLINNTRLKLLALSSPHPWADSAHEQQKLECTSQIDSMADSLASTLPFCLERFEVHPLDSARHQASITTEVDQKIQPHLANLVGWPLSVASCLEGMDGRRQLWFRSELASLGRMIGDGVLECAESDQWGML